MPVLDLSSPRVMGVLNITPDSFSDGGQLGTVARALGRARLMWAEGAAILDVGGESTRPGAAEVSAQEEIDRVVPVIEAIVSEIPLPVSVDTSKSAVMRAAAAAGAAMINDVRALQYEDALQAAVELQLPVCLMHMQGSPQTMQAHPNYVDVVDEVTEFLRQRVADCADSGLARELLMVDPGFGFGKTPQQNIKLLANLSRLREIGCPILIGVSRKSTLGAITGRGVGERLAAGLAAATAAVLEGASIVRTHDVAATVDAVLVANCLIQDGEFE